MAQGPGLINKFRPTALSFNSYGWKGSPLYNRADVPAQWVEGVGSVDRTVIEQQLAYEWLNSSEAGGPGNIWTNPPFLGGAAGRLMSGQTSGGTPARVLRGFIRRSEADIGDVASMSRLYFMYNPETITRQYVSYLDQGALDPFNTVFQSGNLVAPPSYMDFSFSLFFDRQEEAVISSNPGVFVDYQFFDLVVRNVVPATDPNNATNAALPDNGVMMVNPRDITVVFSPQITVQGRPSNATVSFTRFTHRMVPTRMQIDLTMRVTYFGPLKDMTPYVKEENTIAATIPFSPIEDTYQISVEDIAAFHEILKERVNDIITKIKAAGDDTGDTGDSGSTGSNFTSGSGSSFLNTGALDSNVDTNVASIRINQGLLQYTKDQVRANGTVYRYASHTWKQADCSGLIYLAFTEKGYGDIMRWTKGFGVSSENMWNTILKGNDSGSKGVLIFGVDGGKSKTDRIKQIQPKLTQLKAGDLLFRIGVAGKHNHVSWFEGWTGAEGTSSLSVFAAMSESSGVGSSTISADEFAGSYNGAFRPYTSGGYTTAAIPPYGGWPL